MYLVTWDFRSMDVLSVSKFYPVPFDTCNHKPYLLVFGSNFEISSVLFPFFRSGLWTNLHSTFPLTLDLCRLLIWVSMRQASSEVGLKCRWCSYISDIQSHCTSMTFADKRRYYRLFQQVTHKGG